VPANDDRLRYMREFHTSDVELGRIAADANPKMLILYHFGARATSSDAVVAAIQRAGYQGRIVVGKDLDRF
jgi:ribonuclease BN (tRNA processing enzyme)